MGGSASTDPEPGLMAALSRPRLTRLTASTIVGLQLIDTKWLRVATGWRSRYLALMVLFTTLTERCQEVHDIAPELPLTN